ncbi:hypothetical protein [uncultured Methanomethylovorans sp.]|uniref:hypothetical protein n=1 Tax=uncultured Methanomethylovorans sp. TaxID=183759 RepID=UPI002AA7C417|nr:hypothetical protein [uncultured Methanomethylovorans sp.]
MSLIGIAKKVVKKVTDFVNSDKANAGLVMGMLGTIIAVIIAILIGSQFISIGKDMMTDQNNSEGISALGNLETIFYMIIGIVVLLPLVGLGAFVLYMFGGRKQ